MLKDFARELAYRSGAFRAVQQRNRHQVRILMYHRFPEQHVEGFDRQCQHLAENYHVLPLTEILQRLQDRAPLENLAAITIDDGYADVYNTAFPVLCKYKLPATLFVTTGFIKGECWMPGDYVRSYFAQKNAKDITVTDEKGSERQFQAQDPLSSDRLSQLMKRVPNETRSAILGEIIRRQKIDGTDMLGPQYWPCTWDQLREMHRGNLTIGAHTVTHPILSRLGTRQRTEEEIVGSKSTLEQELQSRITTFAYPNGTAEDLDPTSLSIVEQNFDGAVTAMHGMNGDGADLYRLLRLPCDPDLSLSQFARQLAGPIRFSKESGSTPSESRQTLS